MVTGSIFGKPIPAEPFALPQKKGGAREPVGGLDLPANGGGKDLLLRRLDCAVIETSHDIRKLANEPPIDTVSGVFLEGDPIYDNAGFYEKTHIQICVRNPNMIKGIFAPHDSEAET